MLVASIMTLCGACNFAVEVTPLDAPVDTLDGPPAAPKSCGAIHTSQPSAASGNYEIDPDGPGGESPLSVWCDMLTDGGGWSIVFLAPISNLMSITLTYTSSSQRLLDEAQSALLAYRTSAQLVVGDYATLPFPAPWRAAAPFRATGADLTTMVRINAAAATSSTVRYGYQGYQSTCDDAWQGTPNIGRICVVGTTAPFFAGFSNSSADSCGDSSTSAGSLPCATERRFSIAVR
jgi:hypothetical protein